MNARPNYAAEIFTKYYNIIKHDSPKHIQECMVLTDSCHIETLKRLKLILFVHVNFRPDFNIMCEREFGSSKKNFQSLPSLVPKKIYIYP